MSSPSSIKTRTMRSALQMEKENRGVPQLRIMTEMENGDFVEMVSKTLSWV